MADPSIQTFCCHPAMNESDPSISIMMEFNSISYNTVCLVSSSIGMLGALYQLLPRKKPTLSHRWSTISPLRGRQTIIWLALADMLASTGVFFRSILRLKGEFILYVHSFTGSILGTVYCAIFAAWIEYFYCVTWLWTLCYAIDMWLGLRDRPAYTYFYHSLCWVLPSVLTFTGLGILYFPNADCHNLKAGESAFMRILPNYLLTYLPMLVVMIVNPIIYILSLNKVQDLVTLNFSQFTRKERMIVDATKLKFGLIILAFYVCWLPNLVNSILLWTQWPNLPKPALITLWYIMAVVNPLQAFFNSLVYRRSNEKIVYFQRATRQDPASEVTPLIASKIERL
uniref:G-protein coupled receptors family 1 profile domain-containing protein n=2 Tax=Clastoptera arizonana TaxID=38151 RepID=A0A1B6CL95_9HEMI